MTRRPAAWTLALAALLWLGPAATGLGQVTAPACAPREQVLAYLAERYGEEVVALGVTDRGLLAELLVAPESRSWTLLVTRPYGFACLVFSGEGWRELPAPASEDPST